MSEILQQSSDQAERKVIFTTKEIQEQNIPCKFELPEPEHCKYCGRTLYYEGVLAFGSIVTIRRESPERCTCDKALAYWSKKDKEDEEQKKRVDRQKEIEKRQSRMNRLIVNSGMSKRQQFCSFDNYTVTVPGQKNALEIAEKYVTCFEDKKSIGKGLYIEGTNGTGKTHLASAIAMALINKFYSVKCQTAVALLENIKKAYNDYSDYTEDEILDRFRKVDLLIIDDLGKEQVTNWGVATLYSIIDYRYNEMLPTIITTNYNEQMLIERMTVNDDCQNIKAIISRFRETTDVITMAWNDYRGAAHG